MSNEMKIIMENWRSTNLVEGLDTVGDLIKVIKVVRRDKVLKAGGKLIAKLATAGMGDVAEFVGAAMDAGDFASALYGGDLSQKKQPPALQALAVDPDVSRIVANDIEKAFLKHLLNKLETGYKPQTPLSQVDTTELLQDFIAQNFNNKTVKDK
jgi:hypothetical protein